MEYSSLLHLFIGSIVTIVFFHERIHSALILIFLVSISALKEVIDHFFYLNHYPVICMDEHYRDFTFSIVFFFIYIPFITHKRIKEHRYRGLIKAITFVLVFFSLQYANSYFFT